MVICMLAKKVTCSECDYRIQCNKNVVSLPRRRKVTKCVGLRLAA